jgi:hypothetical protein
MGAGTSSGRSGVECSLVDPEVNVRSLDRASGRRQHEPACLKGSPALAVSTVFDDTDYRINLLMMIAARGPIPSTQIVVNQRSLPRDSRHFREVKVGN